MTLRLALDQNFPTDLLRNIQSFLPQPIELAALKGIDPRLTTLDDRALIIALAQLGWDGLITNNYKMLHTPREVAAIIATKSIFIAVEGLGHDPLRAAGALLLELPGLEARLRADRDNVFLLAYRQRGPRDGWDFLKRTAQHLGVETDDLWSSSRPGRSELTRPVLRD